MGLLGWMIFGLCAGFVAQLIMPGGGKDDRMGCLGTMAIGIVGAVIGGFIGTVLGFGDISGFDFRSFLLAILGTVVLLAVVRAIRD